MSRRTPRMQSDADRYLGGLRARQERDRPRDQVDELADAVSDGTPDADMDEVDTGVTPEMEAQIQGDPVSRVLFAKIKHERKRRASDIMAALGKKPPAEQMSAFAKTIRWLRLIVISIAVPALSSTILVVKYLMVKSAAEERARIELEQLKAHDEDYARRVRAVEDLSQRNAQRIDDFFRGRRHEPDFDVAPRRDTTPTRGTP